ncbi:uncharacterized protein TNCV_236251 [Trichonephila clavipes]|nr:uncharacterized protein TNCV_236251 [Trichonephila clavipes]
MFQVAVDKWVDMVTKLSVGSYFCPVVSSYPGVIEDQLHRATNAATRGLLAADNVILNHGQVTWTTPELAPPLLTTTQHQREDAPALDRPNVHRCPTRWVPSGTGIEPVTKQDTIRHPYHSATVAPKEHINYDEHGRHNTDKETTTQRSRLHDYRETSEERRDFQRHRFLYLTVKTT